MQKNTKLYFSFLYDKLTLVMKMKLEYEEIESKKFYDEFLYITYKYNSIKKNPKQKVKRYTDYLLLYVIVYILIIVLIFVSNIDIKDAFGYFLLGGASIMTINYLYYLKVYKKLIKESVKSKPKIKININEDTIHYIEENREYKLKWDVISNVIINKYTITIISKDNSRLLISIPLNYKDDIITCLKKYKKEKLLIDNTELYK